MFLLGIDVGTQGVRTIISSHHGDVVSEEEQAIQLRNPKLKNNSKAEFRKQNWFEQNPENWWNAVCTCIQRLIVNLRKQGYSQKSIEALSVTSTSGTMILIDENKKPVCPAIMYSDGRAVKEAALCNEIAMPLTNRLSYRFSPSFGLPKMVWVNNHHPEWVDRGCCFIHAADFIVGHLTGNYSITDETSALKSGYDLIQEKWPVDVLDKLGIDVHMLPTVVKPGHHIGSVCNKAASETGLSTRTIVVAGMTDGCASQIASGAVLPGDWNSTIGTTLVVKGVARDLVVDPLQRLYCHRHPMGYWLPGGASNTGGEGIEVVFGRTRLRELDERVKDYTPSDILVYPLQRVGERFPFRADGATGFIIGKRDMSEDEKYAGYLEGVAFLERLAFEFVGDLGIGRKRELYVSGGGARSNTWLQIRADVLQNVLKRPRRFGGAMGAAIVAASTTIYQNLFEAVSEMVSFGYIVEPRISFRDRYDELYERFKDELKQRGYL